MSGDLFTQAFVYLTAALIAVPIANRLGLGSVLGYLFAGVVIGPFALGLVGREGQEVMHFAEFGVVMMLFLIGLELRPSLLWEMRRTILGLGGLQVVGTAVAVALIAWALGLAPGAAVTTGMILSLSSTAIVLQSLTEKNLLRTAGGQASFSVLLFQDIAVIPMIAVIPLLAARAPEAVADAHGAGATDRPAWLQALLVLAAIGGIIVAGRFLVRPMFRYLAATRQREVFTAAALFLVIAITLLMQRVGLSAALGTFLAGLVLAESEYRHELEGDLEPFKGLLLGLFFISVGASIDFALLMDQPLLIAALVLGLVLVKLGVLYVVARVFGLVRPARWLFAFALAQGGEFAFVLASFAQQSGVLTREQAGPIVAVVALSMLATPLLLIVVERFVLPRVTDAKAERPDDEIPQHDNPVVIAGFGRFGQIVGRLLRAAGYETTVLDHDAETVEGVQRAGLKVYYGDASRLELLHAAGCARAKVLVLAIDDREKSLQIARAVRTHFPNLHVVARAWDRLHYYELRKLGITHVFRETFGSAMEAGTATLQALGLRAHQAHRAAQAYRAQDARALHELEELWGGDEDVYFAAVRRANEEAERLLKASAKQREVVSDGAFDNEVLRPDA
ncbi:monovalent cation:proton antiporter-2 (CPA2) family protein [Sandaracinus amylolyticus]|uniref:Glutathione-regulated potassium-efflux system protein KefC n=1 Tax=Sandaracinus amylolyticus TaxID=927083 RepID=A0A0F6SD64_9BACT|nr:monovalent cation:proton antiporter-2 (CPA2) family protein [Sandaracinus amylolyticus]AKF02899.1 Glutathione-regulated potassium-efflux system protein KefC [Sandaracinus amylolyticus]